METSSGIDAHGILMYLIEIYSDMQRFNMTKCLAAALTCYKFVPFSRRLS
jgi:hypothetical protein